MVLENGSSIILILLYLVKCMTQSSSRHTSLTSSSSEHDIWLWHKLLRHASFGFLKYIFPKLFSKTSP